MRIDGQNGRNVQAEPMGMSQMTDAYSRSIQKQIENAKERLQNIASDEHLSMEEKSKKRQEIQQEINDLNMQLRQHQIEQRSKKQQQTDSSSMDDMLGGNRKADSKKAGSRSAGLSQTGMTAMLSADASRKLAEVQGSTASRFEERAAILEIEIKLDESRGGNGRTVDTSDKKAEMAEAEQKASDLTAAQMGTLQEANKTLAEATEEEKRSESGETEETEHSFENEASEKTEKTENKEASEETALPEEERAAYAPVDIRL